MTKDHFLHELRTKLKHLPADEVDAAMSYYEEYFLDAGPDNEQKVVAELGSPDAIASKIIGEFAMSDKPAAQKGSMKMLWIVILAVLASPIALPLAFAAIMLVFALLITLFFVILSFGIAVVATIAMGIIAVLTGLAALFVNFGTGLFNIGMGLFAIGCGTLLAIGIIKLGQLCVKGIQHVLGSLLVRKGA